MSSKLTRTSKLGQRGDGKGKKRVYDRMKRFESAPNASNAGHLHHAPGSQNMRKAGKA